MIPIEELNKRPVYMYMKSGIAPTGSGSRIRHFTNARAYLDLGFDVTIVQFSANQNLEDKSIVPPGAKFIMTPSIDGRVNLAQRVSYKIGYPFEETLNAVYRDRKNILDFVTRMESATPGAIHHFEALNTANVAISLKRKKINLVWSNHDWEADRNKKLDGMREEIGQKKKISEKTRRQFQVERIEKNTARSCQLVLMIAEHEAKIYQQQLGIKNAEVFPMSWPDETAPQRTREWVQDGKLNLLHLGSPDSLVGYYSLKFILGEVFPRIPEHIRQKIDLKVVGRIQGTKYYKVIHRLAEDYPQVIFTDFVEETDPFFSASDLQLVGTSTATGLRTRIIESFVKKLPVLSLSEATSGIMGLSNGVNILLENSAEGFALQLVRLLEDPSNLPGMAVMGRKLYDQFYSREIAAQKLRFCLEKHIQSR